MTIPKLSWGEFKDAHGNWLPHLTPREVIASLKAERGRLTAALAAERALADDLAAIAEALLPQAHAGIAFARDHGGGEACTAIYRHNYTDAMAVLARYQAARKGGDGDGGV